MAFMRKWYTVHTALWVFSAVITERVKRGFFLDFWMDDRKKCVMTLSWWQKKGNWTQESSSVHSQAICWVYEAAIVALLGLEQCLDNIEEKRGKKELLQEHNSSRCSCEIGLDYNTNIKPCRGWNQPKNTPSHCGQPAADTSRRGIVGKTIMMIEERFCLHVLSHCTQCKPQEKNHEFIFSPPTAWMVAYPLDHEEFQCFCPLKYVECLSAYPTSIISHILPIRVYPVVFV